MSNMDCDEIQIFAGRAEGRNDFAGRTGNRGPACSDVCSMHTRSEINRRSIRIAAQCSKRRSPESLLYKPSSAYSSKARNSGLRLVGILRICVAGVGAALSCAGFSGRSAILHDCVVCTFQPDADTHAITVEGDYCRTSQRGN